MAGSDAIEIRNLSVAIAANPVLQHIDLTFEKGQFYAILGPNGSGKTTLLRAIAGVLPVETGEITVNGINLQSFGSRSLARELAVVPQETTMEFEFSVLDVVLMGRTPYLPRFAVEGEVDLEIARQAMEMTDTWTLRERSINSLSGGERQRVIVARAIAQQTGIIALDEPVSHLDIYHQIALLKQVRELNRKHQFTVLAVLHDLNLAAAFGDQLILMHQGRVYRRGRPEDILKPDIIHDVYGVNVHVMQLQKTGQPYVIPKI